MAVSLEDRVKHHSDFFDKLVELIPAKYYVPDEANPEWSKFAKTKSAKAAAKQEAKENSKKALRAKLQPGNAQTTLEKIRAAELGSKKGKEGAGKGGDDDDDDDDDEDDDEENESDFEDDVSDEEEDGDDDDDDDDESESESEDDEPPNKKKGKEGAGGGGSAAAAAAAATTAAAAATPAGAPPTSGWSLGDAKSGGNKMEDLRERLKAKIEASRVARKAEESQEKITQAREWREEKKKTKAEKKRKERAEAAVGDILDGKAGGSNKKSKSGAAKGSGGEDAGAGAAGGKRGGGKDAADDIQFGRIEVDGKISGQNKKKRASKQVLLQRAVSQREEIEAAGGEDTAAGKKVAEKYSWDAALSRAGGEKVLDDPKLLQKSVKNEARAKKKSQEKWAKRVAFTEEQMAAKQKKRKDSLKSRADAKVEKRIEKREKKRNRPGFEGRSQGPINP